MDSAEKGRREIMREQVGVLLDWKNLGKTVAAHVPVVGELINQLEDHKTDIRIGDIEERLKSLSKLRQLEQTTKETLPTVHDWPSAVAEFSQRTVDFAVIYDGGFHSRANRGRELVQPVAQACVIGDNEIVAAKEALEFANDIAQHKQGKLVVLAGMAWYAFEEGKADQDSGILLCKLTQRDEEKWAHWNQLRQKYGLGDLGGDLIRSPVRYSVSSFIGHEIGFIHTGEATGVWAGLSEFSPRQFDVSFISHFKRPADDSLKSFVTGVLPGRIQNRGPAVFTRDGILLGLVSNTENYKSDAGRRAVVRSLFGHPRFMKQKV